MLDKTHANGSLVCKPSINTLNALSKPSRKNKSRLFPQALWKNRISQDLTKCKLKRCVAKYILIKNSNRTLFHSNINTNQGWCKSLDSNIGLRLDILYFLEQKYWIGDINHLNVTGCLSIANYAFQEFPCWKVLFYSRSCHLTCFQSEKNHKVYLLWHRAFRWQA